MDMEIGFGKIAYVKSYIEVIDRIYRCLCFFGLLYGGEVKGVIYK